MIRKNRLLLFLSFLAFISLGLPDGLLGVAWPSLAGEMGQPLSRLAILQLSATGGFFLSSTTAGLLIRRLGVGRLLILSNVLVFIALAGFTLALLNFKERHFYSRHRRRTEVHCGIHGSCRTGRL